MTAFWGGRPLAARANRLKIDTPGIAPDCDLNGIIRGAMKNSDTSSPMTKRPAHEGRAAPDQKDISAGSQDSLARGFVPNRSQRFLKIDFDFGIERLAHGGNEWTH